VRYLSPEALIAALVVKAALFLAGWLNDDKMSVLLLASTAPVLLVYFILCECMIGQTVGKMLAGIQVLDNVAGKASFMQCYVRLAASLFFLVFLPLLLINLAMVAAGRRSFTDKLSGTKVIPK